MPAVPIVDRLIQVFALSGRLVARLFPYVMVGVLIGEGLKYVRWTRWIERACQQHPVIAIVWATLLGMASPLCTYGTVPIVLQLARTGTPVFPLITFLSASSLMNPQLFLVTWQGIGVEMALARAVSVLAFGVLLGLALWRLPSAWVVNPRAFERVDAQAEDGGRRPKKLEWRGFVRAGWRSFQFVAFYYMVLGILLGSAIEVFVPGEWILRLFSPGEWFALPLAAILSVPLYACGGGTIPLIRSLLLGGMGKGSALAFFLVGPATRFTPLLGLATVLRGAFLVAYVSALILFSLLAGLIFQSV